MVNEMVSALLDDRDPWPNAVTSANWTISVRGHLCSRVSRKGWRAGSSTRIHAGLTRVVEALPSHVEWQRCHLFGRLDSVRLLQAREPAKLLQQFNTGSTQSHSENLGMCSIGLTESFCAAFVCHFLKIVVADILAST